MNGTSREQEPRWSPTRGQVWRTVVVIALLAVLVYVGYSYEWTGLGESRVPKKTTEDIRRAKTFWDWSQLLVVPLVLALGGFLLTRAENRNAQVIADQRAQDTMLQTYLDQMGQLLLDRDLRSSGASDEVRILARARTLTVLETLDGDRKTSLLQFLYEARLIDEKKPVVSLVSANLAGANLRYLNLSKANLSRANLSGANLEGANLEGANLSGAELRRARLLNVGLRESSLNDANLRNASLFGVDLEYSDLSGADFFEAKLPHSKLSGAILTKTGLYRVDMTGADLSDTDLTKTLLMDANLTIATLDRCNLTGVCLVRVNLTRATLVNAKLAQTELVDVTLSGAKVAKEQLAQVTKQVRVTLPDYPKFH